VACASALQDRYRLSGARPVPSKPLASCESQAPCCCIWAVPEHVLSAAERGTSCLAVSACPGQLWVFVSADLLPCRACRGVDDNAELCGPVPARLLSTVCTLATLWSTADVLHSCLVPAHGLPAITSWLP
jgi:hypothetical protein